jgi:hypothetical protein
MALFKNAESSHEHSLEFLNLLYAHDSFLDSLSTIADMGCGAGLDVEWWASLYTREDPPEPRNYTVYAVDRDIRPLEPRISDLHNVFPIEADFTHRCVPRQVDLIWSHDSFQYALNPFETLASWNKSMNVNGMLAMCLPQPVYMQNNHLQSRGYSGQYYNYNMLNLMYMLGVSGFDCRDAYFYRTYNHQWLYAAVYKSCDPMDPATTSWFDLADKNLVNDSIKMSLDRYGHARLEDLIVVWLDKNLYKVND